MQACSRTFFAFSRDHGLPDRGLFTKLSKNKVPVYAVALVVFWAAILGMLDFASVVALNAIFALCAIALDSRFVDSPIVVERGTTTETDLYVKLHCPGGLPVRRPFRTGSRASQAVDLNLYALFHRLIFKDHPEVMFKPGPFALPPTLSKIVSIIAIAWVRHPALWRKEGS